MKRYILLLTLCLSSYVAATAQDAGNVIPFQGQLANQAGQPLSPSSPSTLVFRLYRQAVGGIAIWEESQANISVSAGRFSVLLGSRTELPAASNFNATLYLGITVDDGSPATADVEMRPRQALVPVMSANSARNADKLNGFDWIPVFGVNDPTGPIPASKLAEGSLPASKLLPLSIGSNQIAAGGISGDRIAPGTITQREIANDSLTLGLLAKDVLDRLAPTGAIAKHQVFTNSGDWTAPTNLSAPFVVLYGIGGGGGGGSGSTGYIVGGVGNAIGLGGAGGGAAYPASRIVPVTPGTAYSVTVGAGGIGNPLNTSGDGSSGGDGGTTSFAALASWLGGRGGGGGLIPSGSTPGVARSPGAQGGKNGSSGGDTIFALGGQVGSGGATGGGGGAAGVGSGANGGNNNSGSGGSAVANSGAGGGGGGGGGSGSSSPGRPGGDGGSGFLEIIWFAPQ